METRTLPTLTRIRCSYDAEGMEELFLRIDELHDYAAAGRLEAATPLSRAELRGWLEDIIYTARETLHEIEGRIEI